MATALEWIPRCWHETLKPPPVAARDACTPIVGSGTFMPPSVESGGSALDARCREAASHRVDAYFACRITGGGNQRLTDERIDGRRGCEPNDDGHVIATLICRQVFERRTQPNSQQALGRQERPVAPAEQPCHLLVAIRHPAHVQLLQVGAPVAQHRLRTNVRRSRASHCVQVY